MFSRPRSTRSAGSLTVQSCRVRLCRTSQFARSVSLHGLEKIISAKSLEVARVIAALALFGKRTEVGLVLLISPPEPRSDWGGRRLVLVSCGDAEADELTPVPRRSRGVGGKFGQRGQPGGPERGTKTNLRAHQARPSESRCAVPETRCSRHINTDVEQRRCFESDDNLEARSRHCYLASIGFRNFPVCEPRFLATASGVPTATT